MLHAQLADIETGGSLLDDRLELLLRWTDRRRILPQGRPEILATMLYSVAHLGVLVRITSIAADSILAHRVLKLAGFVYVEGQIALQLDHLPLSYLHLLEVRLSLVLQGRVRLH